MSKGPKRAQSEMTSDQDPAQKALSIIQSDYERRYVCPDCNKELSCGSSLKRHLLLKHKKEMTLKFGRTFKGGRSFSNQRYYMKKRKPKDVEKTDRQLKRSMVNQRAYQKKVFKAEAESLQQAIIDKTDLIVQQYKDAKNLRKHLDVVAMNLKAQHQDSVYTEIQTTLGFPDTFEIRYSIAFYFLLAIANRLPHFINLEYDRKETAIGLCWRHADLDGASDEFRYNDRITTAIFEQMDVYFLGKGKAIKEQKLKYMSCIASFLNVVFTGCGNKHVFIERESKSPCHLLRTVLKEPLIPLPPSIPSKKDALQDDTSDTDKPDIKLLNPVPVSSTESNDPVLINSPPVTVKMQNSERRKSTAIRANNATNSVSSYSKPKFRFAKNLFVSSWPSSNQSSNDK